MSPDQKTSDITVRGGLISVPNSSKSTRPPRHQPNTPPTKKKVTPRADHIPAPTKTPAPPVPTPAIPDGEEPNEPTKTSQSD